MGILVVYRATMSLKEITILCLVFALALATPQDPRGKPIDEFKGDEDYSIEEDEDYSIEEDELEDEDYLEDELDEDDFLVEGDRIEDFDMPEFGVPDEDGNYRVGDMMMTEEQFRSMFGPED